MRITIRGGLNIPLSGGPEPTIDLGRKVRSVALLGRDYTGLKPRMMVREGDEVSLGDTLFVDKRDSAVAYTAPGTGTVAAISRGERRALLSVVIDLDPSAAESVRFPDLADGRIDSLGGPAFERPRHAQTMAFATLIFAQLWHVFDSRSSTTIFRKNPFGNQMLLAAVALSAILSLGAIYTPLGNIVLGTEPLEFRHLVEVVAIASLPTLALSALKEIFRFDFLCTAIGIT